MAKGKRKRAEWDDMASNEADGAQAISFHEHRGAQEWAYEPGVSVCFGNLGKGDAQDREVRELQAELGQWGCEVLGFGRSGDEDEYTWAMMVRGDVGDVKAAWRLAVERMIKGGVTPPGQLEWLGLSPGI